jgi:hypothetical protein
MAASSSGVRQKFADDGLGQAAVRTALLRLFSLPAHSRFRLVLTRVRDMFRLSRPFTK